MLEGSDIEIIGYCRSGEEALEQYGTMKPDLVTLDIVMPGMDGLETCKSCGNTTQKPIFSWYLPWPMTI